MKKRVLCVVLVAVMVLVTLCACTTEGDDLKYKTSIKVWNWGGAAGDEWLKDAAKRFSALKQDVSYEDGKKGVTFSYGGSTNPGEFDTMDTSTYAIYFSECGSSPYQLAQGNKLYCVNDILASSAYGESATILSKIDSNIQDSLKGKDGNYYALPHFEWYSGLVYDIDTFKSAGLYIADSNETSGTELYESDFGTVRFVKKESSAKRSCGNDGVFGTEDDGLPTSFTEFLVLCDRMNENGITPFTVPGNHIDYSSYLVNGLMGSLLGDKVSGFFTFNGTFDIVTGFSDENLFEGIDYIKKPVTEQVQLTEATGYLTRNIVERYYALSILEIAEKEGWFSDDSNSTAINNLTAQYDFIMGPRNTGKYRPCGFLMDGSYWYIEAERESTFDEYERYTQKERNIGYMSLPTSLYSSVTEGNGKTISLIDHACSFLLVNKKVVDGNEGLLQAVTEFIQFLYSEQELKNFTKATGLAKAGINYGYTDSDVMESLSVYQQSILSLKKNNNVIYSFATNDTFLANQSSLRLDNSCDINAPMINSVTYGSCLAAMRKGHNTEACFNATAISQSTWNSKYYKGE